jgi:hypothetical protein
MSDEGRVIRSDMVRKHHAARGNTLSGQGVLCTWQFQEYPDKAGPVNNGTSLEVNRNEQGRMCVST